MSVNLPRHVAIIMDGNGRWAAARKLPRHAGHKAGISALRACVQTCTARGIGALTVFAFSSENWSRPAEEVSLLMGLFVDALDQEVDELHGNGVRLRFIGDRQRLSVRLQAYLAACTWERWRRGELALRRLLLPAMALAAAIAWAYLANPGPDPAAFARLVDYGGDLVVPG